MLFCKFELFDLFKNKELIHSNLFACQNQIHDSNIYAFLGGVLMASGFFSLYWHRLLPRLIRLGVGTIDSPDKSRQVFDQYDPSEVPEKFLGRLLDGLS